MVRKIAALLGALVLGVVGALVLASPAEAVVVSYVVTSQWATGYTVDFTVDNNTGVPTTTWDIVFDLPSTSTVSVVWNGALMGTTPHFVILADAGTGGIAPYTTLDVGMIVSGVDPLQLL